MARQKKDGKHINYYIDRIIAERLEAYAAAKRQTITAALEDLLCESLDRYDIRIKEAQSEKPQE